MYVQQLYKVLHPWTVLNMFDRRLHDLEAQNRDLLHTIAKREEALHQANVCSHLFHFTLLYDH